MAAQRPRWYGKVSSTRLVLRSRVNVTNKHEIVEGRNRLDALKKANKELADYPGDPHAGELNLQTYSADLIQEVLAFVENKITIASKLRRETFIHFGIEHYE
jgi:hypothetical protein